jgi:signal transduction histidine kinase
LGEAINITVYCIIQECLTNVAKHAEATSVEIQLTRESVGTLTLRPEPELSPHHTLHGDFVKLVISDDGRGMDVNAQAGGLGILGMRERAQALKRIFTLQSSPGLGGMHRGHDPHHALTGQLP